MHLMRFTAGVGGGYSFYGLEVDVCWVKVEVIEQLRVKRYFKTLVYCSKCAY